jgi:hypothetical protein
MRKALECRRVLGAKVALKFRKLDMATLSLIFDNELFLTFVLVVVNKC